MLAEERSPSDLLGCYTNERASFFISIAKLSSIKEGKEEQFLESLTIPYNHFSLQVTSFL